ncbi:hypothetical protein BROSI_A2264 [Candidatus Brocadia sinica JPN1]|uniref:Uncharacterized protein n=1 Tax=Candidatus Brocadia sinica JPN1 TaxID=1197129 RepID=A0ABQ0JYC8_9BACT|nr:hypothetical protein BROSI_A2264 [Candidatus Brocadia sinica JPN1]
MKIIGIPMAISMFVLFVQTFENIIGNLLYKIG